MSAIYEHKYNMLMFLDVFIVQNKRSIIFYTITNTH